MEKENKNLSVVVQLSDSVGISLESDLSKLSESQEDKLRDFLISLLERPKIRAIDSFPEMVRIIPEDFYVI